MWVCQRLKTIFQAMALVIRNHLVPWELTIPPVFPQPKGCNLSSTKTETPMLYVNVPTINRQDPSWCFSSRQALENKREA